MTKRPEQEEVKLTGLKRAKLSKDYVVGTTMSSLCYSCDDHSCCCSSNEDDIAQLGKQECNYEKNRKKRTMSNASREMGVTKEEQAGKETRQKLTVKRVTVTRAEVDDFFAECEKDERIQLKELEKKYNFDFVNEKPLEGRFVWEKVEP